MILPESCWVSMIVRNRKPGPPESDSCVPPLPDSKLAIVPANKAPRLTRSRGASPADHRSHGLRQLCAERGHSAGLQRTAACNQVRGTTSRPAPQYGTSSLRHTAGRLLEDAGRLPSRTCEEAPFAVRATTCEEAPFAVRASLPLTSPKSLFRSGDSNRPRVPGGVLRSSAHPFVPRCRAGAGCLIGGRAHHRRDRTIAIGRIAYGTAQTCEFRRRGLSL